MKKHHIWLLVITAVIVAVYVLHKHKSTIAADYTVTVGPGGQSIMY